MKAYTNTPSIEVEVHPNLNSKNDDLSGFFFNKEDAMIYLRNIKDIVFTAKIDNVEIDIMAL
jgi:hypothetical protein